MAQGVCCCQKEQRTNMRFQNSPICGILRIVIPCTVYVGINLLISILFLCAATLLTGDGTQAQVLVEEYSYELMIAVALATIPVMTVLMRRDRERESRLGVVSEKSVLSSISYLAVAILGIGACLTVNHLLSLSGLTELLSQDLENVSSVLYQNHLAAELLGVGLIVPIAEELIFRGLTMKRLQEVFGIRPAIVLSAAVFALFHGNLLQGIYAFVLGLLLAWVYGKLRRLSAPILLHASANLTSVLISDTDLLDFVYDDTMLFLAVTVGAGLVTIAMILVLQRDGAEI